MKKDGLLKNIYKAVYNFWQRLAGLPFKIKDTQDHLNAASIVVGNVKSAVIKKQQTVFIL